MLIQPPKLDITDDGFLNLMTGDGEPKDDVKMPDGDVGAKINKLFKEEEKDTRRFCPEPMATNATANIASLVVTVQTAMGEEAAIDAKEGAK